MKKHNDMKKIKSVIILAFALLLYCQAQAQSQKTDNWWGQDTVVVCKEDNNSQTVVIGLDKDSKDKSYQWTGPNIQGPANGPTVTVNPQEPETEYIVRRVSKCGVEEARVLVIVTDEIEIVSIKDRCFMLGEPVTTKSFQIVTRPEGHGDEVEVYPNEANVLGRQPFLFRLEHNDHVSTKFAYMDVYTLDDHDTVKPKTYPVTFTQIINFFKKAKGILFKAKKVEEVVKTVAPPNLSPCRPDMGGTLDIPLKLPKFYKKACCNGDTVPSGDALKFYLPGLTAYYGIDCEFPVPNVSIPHIGGIYVVLGFNASMSLGPTTIIALSKECIDGSMPINLNASIYGGAKVQFADPDFLRAELRLEGAAAAELIWNIGKNLDMSKGITLTSTLKCNITVIGLGSKEFKYDLIPPITVLNEE